MNNAILALFPVIGMCIGASCASMYVEVKRMERRGEFDEPN